MLAKICLISLHLSRVTPPLLPIPDQGPMKITDIETIVLRLPEVKPIGDGCQSILLVRIRTDEGVTGIGEVHTNPTVSKAIIEAPLCSVASRGLRDVLIGENPLDIARLWDRMYQATQIYGRRGAVMHAISG